MLSLKARLEDALKGIDQDILGAYFFNEPKVRIFWASIGIIARLLSVQSDTYTIHRTWKQEGGSRAGEIVRSAMIGSRTRGVVAYAEFAELLRESQSQLATHEASRSR